MGNCSLRAISNGENPSPIRVFTDSGEALEFSCPKLAGDILQEYPGYGIYGKSCISSPLSGDETLARGQAYYLVPLRTNPRIFQDREVDVKPKIQVSPIRRNGVWKAKVVIGTKQLEEILAEAENTQALIEQLRTAAAASATGFVGDLSQRRLARKNVEHYFC